MPLVSISDAQRAPLRDANWLATVHHGLPPDLYPFDPCGGDYLAFVGRISPEKRPDTAIAVLTALFDASLGLEERHLPQLFCGFDRTPRSRPVPYPVACQPQAWSAASLCLLIQATLGLSVDAWRRRLIFSQAALPQWIEHVEIRELRVRDARIDLRIVRGRRSAALEIIGRDGELDVIARK